MEISHRGVGLLLGTLWDGEGEGRQGLGITNRCKRVKIVECRV